MVRTFTSAVVAAMLVTPAIAETATIETNRGSAEVQTDPQSIAALDIAAIDILDSFGRTVQGAPDDTYMSYIDDAVEGAERLGGLFEFDIEKLAALNPDLVIVGMRSSNAYDAVSGVAPTIDMGTWGQDLLGQVKSRVENYGVLLNDAERADKIIAELDAAVEEAHAAAEGKGNGLILMTNGPAVSAFGPGSRFSFIHEITGLEPAIQDVEAATHGEAISFEFIKNANPDWLIVIDRDVAVGQGAEGALVTLDNELVHDTTAWKEDQIIMLPATEMYIVGGGVQALHNVLDTLTEGFAE